jgi:hypothetical protein
VTTLADHVIDEALRVGPTSARPAVCFEAARAALSVKRAGTADDPEIRRSLRSILNSLVLIRFNRKGDLP